MHFIYRIRTVASFFAMAAIIVQCTGFLIVNYTVRMLSKQAFKQYIARSDYSSEILSFSKKDYNSLPKPNNHEIIVDGHYFDIVSTLTLHDTIKVRCVRDAVEERIISEVFATLVSKSSESPASIPLGNIVKTILKLLIKDAIPFTRDIFSFWINAEIFQLDCSAVIASFPMEIPVPPPENTLHTT